MLHLGFRFACGASDLLVHDPCLPACHHSLARATSRESREPKDAFRGRSNLPVPGKVPRPRRRQQATEGKFGQHADGCFRQTSHPDKTPSLQQAQPLQGCEFLLRWPPVLHAPHAFLSSFKLQDSCIKSSASCQKFHRWSPTKELYETSRSV